MTTLVIILVAVIVLILLAAFYLFARLNKYISSLEVKIGQTITLTENLKQTLRDILVDHSFLLDDGKLKPMPMQKERVAIINGIGGPSLEESNIEF